MKQILFDSREEVLRCCQVDRAHPLVNLPIAMGTGDACVLSRSNPKSETQGSLEAP